MSDPRSAARYEIRIDAVLDEEWTAWFDGLQVIRADDQTVIAGPVADQSALHGLLAKVRDLGVCLVSVQRIDRGRHGPSLPT